MNHNQQRKVAVINDFSSFGRCSLAASIPILSAMRVQCCAVPTAVFTNHTGFKHFSFADMSARMNAYIEDWQATGLAFSAIASGYLASIEQVDFVKRFVASFPEGQPIVFVDPVMGDYGKLYPSFGRDVAEGLRDLLSIADYLTPNLTEACVLANRPYDIALTDAEIGALAEEIAAPHAKGIVISGVPRDDHLVNFVYTRQTGVVCIDAKKIGPDRSGTGDVFASVVLGSLIRGCTLPEAVRNAVDFVSSAVARAEEMEIPTTDGLPFEEVLSKLW